jgi:hypothetical protein
MKSVALAIAIIAAAAGLAGGPAAAAGWDGGAFLQVQAQRGPGGGREGGREGAREGRGGGDPRGLKQERPQDDRRERMSEDARRSLHRDLDKANRELYGRRVPK